MSYKYTQTKNGIIIQARMGSTRLPKKMVLPFKNDKGILEVLLNRLVKANLSIPIILATSTNTLDDQIEKIARGENVFVYRGEEFNVLKRFINAAELFGLEKIIRICADNPFLDIEALKVQIQDFFNRDCEYWYYAKEDLTPTIRTHYGFWSEGVSLAALKKIDTNTKDRKYQEHVTNYIYTYPDLFNSYFKLIDKEVDEEYNLRLTIDTIKDFNLAKTIYSKLIKEKITLNAIQITKYVKENSEWLKNMQNEINNNAK